MAGRIIGELQENGMLAGVTHMPRNCREHLLRSAEGTVDMIYLCCPNNPTGTTFSGMSEEMGGLRPGQ